MVLLNYKDLVIQTAFSESLLDQGTFLWVIHADKIPPHIGLSIDGRFYSLKAKGVDFDRDAALMLQVIKTKAIKTLFYRLPQMDIVQVQEMFNRFTTATSDNATCLQPIKELVNDAVSPTIHGLLETLAEREQLSEVFGLNIDSSFTGIHDYTLADIHQRLDKLHGRG